MKKMLLLWVFGMILVTATHAQMKGIIKAGYYLGGQDVLEDYSLPNGYSLFAGKGYEVEGGVSFQLFEDKKELETQLMVGYKVSSVDTVIGGLDLTRTTFTALELYHHEQFSIGGGLTYHLSPTLESTGYIKGFKGDFDSALGLALQGSFDYTEELSLGIKGTIITYEVSEFDIEYDGSSVGIFISYKF